MATMLGKFIYRVEAKLLTVRLFALYKHAHSQLSVYLKATAQAFRVIHSQELLRSRKSQIEDSQSAAWPCLSIVTIAVRLLST
jgi:hypothetical protein